MQQKSPMLRLWELGEQYHGGLIRAVLSASIGVLCGILPYFAAAQIIIGLIHREQYASYYLLWCAAALGGYVLRAVLYALALSMSHKATFSILKEIRERILAKLPKLPLGTVMDTPSGQMKQIIMDQVESMERPLAHLLPEMTSNILAPVCILVYLFVLDWRMALLSLVSIPVGMAFMMAVMANYGKQYEGSVKVTQEMNSTIVEYIGGIEVIKAFNQGKHSYEKLSQRVLANASYFYHWMKSCQLPVSISRTLAPTTLITILPAGWALHLGGSLDIETFVTVIILSLGIAGPLLAAMDFVDSLAKVGTIVGQVDSILNSKEQQHGMTPVSFDSMDIRLGHVSFGYHADQEVLHDVSLAIPSGTVTAFVGPSGSGKSTIAKLIAGFWDVKKGTITLGGHDLRDIPLSQLYEQTAFVSQDNYLFNESVRENIRMGKPGASDREVEAAAKAAGCDAFIRNLEQGYDTLVGGGGAHLSGGERQRIAIARAMLKNAPIIIFDEATANVDPENEDKLQKAMEELTRDKTIIMIAHRLKTVQKADQILVLDEGVIAERGTHAELSEKPGLYRDFLNARKEAAGWKLA
ncbi:ABC transporter ATP-binding protein [Eubacterium sp. ER2]|uniref:ABC transporter ATP-binding protein n=1 Tax=Eubacterium sp. ER2 TaxID=1519438 RepID=UPI00051CA143|nr:ABC transporter ATP-binding protein [Eubacterium sp. ER2]